MRRIVPAAAVLALALGLTACGSSGGSTTAEDSSGSGATGSAVSHVVKTNALFADMTEAMGQATSAKVRFSSAALTQQVSGTGTFRFGKQLAADMSVTVAGQGLIRIVVTPKAFYLKLPPSTALAGGKSWIKISSGGDDALSAAFGPMLEQLKESLDPASSAALLTSTTSVKRVGTQVVGGVPTTKYTATVDLAKVAKAVGGSLAAQYTALRTSQTTTLDYTLWVDAKSLPRKFSTTIETPQGDVTATGTYSDWGAPVTITPPADSEIADSSGLSAPATAGSGA